MTKEKIHINAIGKTASKVFDSVPTFDELEIRLEGLTHDYKRVLLNEGFKNLGDCTDDADLILAKSYFDNHIEGTFDSRLAMFAIRVHQLAYEFGVDLNTLIPEHIYRQGLKNVEK